MKRLPEVETAKELMNEAMKWSVMKWLREKKRVRRTADQANAALDRLTDELKQHWPEEIGSAYEALTNENPNPNKNGRTCQHLASAGKPGASAIAEKLKDAHDQAYRARIVAEQTFDEAEKRLSTSLAREGCMKAIEGWELHQKAINQSENVSK